MQNLGTGALAGATGLKYPGRMMHAGDILADELAPFSVDELPEMGHGEITRISGTDYLTLVHEKYPEHRPASYVRGVSLSAVLQLLYLERKTCVLEVIGDGATGKLTLVNGEIADADAEGLQGEDAVFRILTWHRPRTTIIEGVSFFRHSITLPIPHVLLEVARRLDEGNAEPQPSSWHGCVADDFGPSLGGDEWHRITETLIVNGALLAAVVQAADVQVLAIADEYGRLSVDTAQAQMDQIAPLTRTVQKWADLIDPAIDELIAVIGRRQYLISPIDASRSLFACVALGSTESLELARHAIRNSAR